MAAVNRFDDMSAHFVDYTDSTANNGSGANFTRADFAASFPKAPTAADLKASDEVIAALGEYKPDYYDSSDQMPTTGANNGLAAVALRGLPYDDPKWDQLLDQMTAKQMASLIYAGNQGTAAVSSISLPKTTATDGPAGLKQYGGLSMGVSGNFNCCGTLVAATWNVELAEAYGNTVGNEAVQAGADAWYAPGLDMHRTAFGGRNFEYYNDEPQMHVEQGVLAGALIAVGVVVTKKSRQEECGKLTVAAMQKSNYNKKLEENKMKKLSKVLTLVLALTMILSLAACGQKGPAAGPAELYNCQSDFVEAGYEGDCIMTNAYVLALNTDGSYTLMKNFFVNQVMGNVVAYTTDYFSGTYTVKSEADGVKTVDLSAPTSCPENMNGSPLTSAEDSSLLEGFAGGAVTCDTATNTLTIG